MLQAWVLQSSRATHHGRGDGHDGVVEGKTRHARKHVQVGHKGAGKTADGCAHEKDLGFVPVNIEPRIHHGSVIVVDGFDNQAVIGCHDSSKAEQGAQKGNLYEVGSRHLIGKWG